MPCASGKGVPPHKAIALLLASRGCDFVNGRVHCVDGRILAAF